MLQGLIATVVQSAGLTVVPTTYCDRVRELQVPPSRHQPQENVALVEGSRVDFIIASTQAGTEVTLMTTDLDTTGSEERRSIWLGLGKILFIVVLAVLFFCWLTTWCVTASLEEVGATTTVPSRHEKT